MYRNWGVCMAHIYSTKLIIMMETGSALLYRINNSQYVQFHGVVDKAVEKPVQHEVLVCKRSREEENQETNKSM